MLLSLRQCRLHTCSPVDGNERFYMRAPRKRAHRKSKRMTLEEKVLAYIEDDALVEVTPKSIRWRKKLLDEKPQEG